MNLHEQEINAKKVFEELSQNATIQLNEIDKLINFPDKKKEIISSIDYYVKIRINEFLALQKWMNMRSQHVSKNEMEITNNYFEYLSSIVCPIKKLKLKEK